MQNCHIWGRDGNSRDDCKALARVQLYYLETILAYDKHHVSVSYSFVYLGTTLCSAPSSVLRSLSWAFRGSDSARYQTWAYIMPSLGSVHWSISLVWSLPARYWMFQWRLKTFNPLSLLGEMALTLILHVISTTNNIVFSVHYRS